MRGDLMKFKTQEERDKFIIENMNLVQQIAKSYAKKNNIDAHELESYGYEGLIFAVDHNKIEDYNILKAYVSRYIQCYILKGVAKIKNYCSENMYYRFLKIKQKFEEETDTILEENPELIYDILDYMEDNKIITKKICNHLETRFFLQMAESLTIHKENLAISDENLFFKNTESVCKEQIENILNSLTPRQKHIIKETFGFDKKEPKSRKMIGEQLGITQEAVRQNQMTAIDKITSLHYQELKCILESYQEKDELPYQVKEKRK